MNKSSVQFMLLLSLLLILCVILRRVNISVRRFRFSKFYGVQELIGRSEPCVQCIALFTWHQPSPAQNIHPPVTPSRSPYFNISRLKFKFAFACLCSEPGLRKNLFTNLDNSDLLISRHGYAMMR